MSPSKVSAFKLLEESTQKNEFLTGSDLRRRQAARFS